MKERQTAIQLARVYYQARPVYLDTETTGLNDWDEIVEICILDHDGSVLLDTLVKPRQSIPVEAVRIHGISGAMVEQAPAWPQVWPQVEAILRGRYVGIYNAEFDKRMLRQTHQAHSLEWDPRGISFFCIMDLFTRYYGSGRMQKLETAGEYFRLSFPNSHRARADTILARAVLERMAGV